MSASVTVTYTEKADAGALAHAAITAALQDVVDNGLEEANRTVPLEDGPLMGSGFTQVQNFSGNTVTGQIAYNTPYAVYQHEDASLHHDDGRTDHWLEKTVEANRQTYVEYIAAEVKRRLS